MTPLLHHLVAEACSITCAVFAGLLALYDKSGWGWFLLVALLTTVTRWDKDK